MTTPTRMTKTQRIAKERFGYYMWQAQWEDEVHVQLRDQIPQAWHRLEHDLDVTEPKMKVTLRLDKSVAKFYRAMGHGYQARINRILATYAQLKIADALRIERIEAELLRELHGERDPIPDDIEEGEGE